MKRRFSVLIPAILMAVAVVSSGLMFVLESRYDRQDVERRTVEILRLDMGQLQNILYNRLTEGDEEEALLSLSLSAMRPGVRTLLVADGSNHVVLSNRYRTKGDDAAAASSYSRGDAFLTVQSGMPRVAPNAKNPTLLQGYFPLIVSYRRGGLEKETGVLYVEQDISAELAATREESLEQALIFGAVSLFASVLIALILHRLLTRRIEKLAAASARFAAGDYEARSGIRGQDELAELGQAFDEMAKRVTEGIVAREQAAAIRKRVVETANDGYWQLDGDGRLIDVNEAYCRMSGYSREELLAMRIADLEAKESTPEEVKTHMEQIFARGWDQFETLHRHKDGHLFEVEVATTYWKDMRQFFAFVRDITGRKRLERELLKRKEQYDRLAENIPIGVYLLRTNPPDKFRFEYVSPQFCVLYGLEAEAVYADAMATFNAIHPDDFLEFVEQVNKSVDELGRFLWEGRAIVGGEVRWLHIESSPEPQEDGECLWNGIVADISDRKRAEMELEDERERLKEAEKIGEFGSWELDHIAGTLNWSDEIFRIFELDRERFAASYEAFLGAIHPDDRDRVNQAFTDSLQNRKPYQITHRLLMPDGRIKWVEERCNTTFDADGKPLRSMGTMQDITRKELVATELRIAAVAFETQEAILVTDSEARIVKVNRAFEEVTGYSSEEAIGKNPSILKSGRHDQAFYEAMWKAVELDGRWSGEVWDRRKDGGVFPKWLTITSVKDDEGAVTHYVAVFVDITERKKAEEEIRSLAFYDPLTKLPNRRLMLDRMRLALAQSQRAEAYCALMFLDLDNFKVLNDTKGHEYGDKLLVEVANRLMHGLRESDSVARFGGDEFVVLLEGLSPERDTAIAQAGYISEKVRASLAQTYRLGEVEHSSSPSIGVVLFKGEAQPVEELLKQADLAMYQAKSGGKNMVRFFETEMQVVLESRTMLENALRQALPNGELELHYQLQTNDKRELLGAEILLRWRSPTLGMVSPADFIPLAEQSKLILPIGRWVLESACRQIKAWEQHPQLRYMHLAVNISPVQFHQSDFVRQVRTILDETGANPRRLELELTENLVLDDVEEATSKMKALREIGVRFSMDDFGTGYSSLQYIKQLPIDMLKIDQSFVRDILTDPGDAVMVQTIAGLAKNFGFRVIAEGVETHDQLTPLIERDCRQFQGYLFSKPLPLTEFESLVERWD